MVSQSLTLWNFINTNNTVHARLLHLAHALELSQRYYLLSAVSLVSLVLLRRRLTWRFCRATYALSCGQRRKYGRNGHRLLEQFQIRSISDVTLLELRSISDVSQLELLSRAVQGRTRETEPLVHRLSHRWQNMYSSLSENVSFVNKIWKFVDDGTLRHYSLNDRKYKILSLVSG
jgi:hypothetical protein